jgi:AraC-like DNA-binding protein
MKIDNIAFQQAVQGNWKVPLAPTRHHILFLVIKGTFIYKIANRTIRVNKGEGLFIPQDTMRSAEIDSSNPHLMYSAHFRDLSLVDLSSFLDEPFKLIQPLSYDYLKQRFSMLNECWIGKMPNYELISRGILLEILGLVQRELTGGGHSSTRRNLALRIQQYIVQHFREPLRLSELAQHVDRSQTYVSTAFKEVTGRTPVEYMHEVRTSAARELLMTTNMTIGEISESLGYCDQTYFNYMYKKIVGHPPSHTLKIREPL